MTGEGAAFPSYGAALTAVAPAPPGPPKPGSRAARRAAQRAARRRRARRIGLVAAALCAAAAVTAGVVVALPGHAARPVVHAAAARRTQQTLFVALRGTDGRVVEGALLAYDAGTKSGTAVLIPAPVVADVPGHGTMTLADTSQFAAPALPGETLGDLMGVTVDGTWLLDLDGLRALVDQVGGVTVDVDTDVDGTGPGGQPVVLVPHGPAQHLTGQQAVAFATYLASGEQEQARLARFDAVLAALLTALPTDASTVAARIGPLVTSTTATEPAAAVAGMLAGLAGDVKAGSASYVDLPVQLSGSGAPIYTVDGGQLGSVVQRYLAESVPRPGDAGPNRVIVLNGTGALNLGESARAKLLAHGLVFVRSGNQQGFTFHNQHSVVLIASDTPALRAAGGRVAAALGLPPNEVQLTDQAVPDADVVAILGDDYRP